MKLESSQYGIECNPEYGPIFGGEYYDIKITNDCNKEYSCSIFNDGSRGYECSPFYKISLFVNSAEQNKMNWFSVSDYEVYTFDYQCKYSVYHNCIQPDIIWEYICDYKATKFLISYTVSTRERIYNAQSQNNQSY